MAVPELRIRPVNDHRVNESGDFVLYWMIAHRRLNWNFSLDRAIEWSRQLGKPLLVLEALRTGYQWASVRIHRFVVQGMADNKAEAAKHGLTYYPYLEPDGQQGRGLLQAFAKHAAVVVTDDFPCFFLPRMVDAAGRQVEVCMESVDSNGLYPMRDTERVFTRAFSFRNHLQKVLSPHLDQFPTADPLAEDFLKNSVIPSEIRASWPEAHADQLQANSDFLATLPIDQAVGPGLLDGGPCAAKRQLQSFLRSRFERYGDDRNQPDIDPSSGLSPYLHFGHISAHEVFSEVCRVERWSLANLGDVKISKGSRNGWWQMSPTAESFLDELITWRELGYNACCHDSNYAKYESLPDFALKTLSDHAKDHRPYLYSLDELQNAATHDDIWNAAQNQLVLEGRMHNYLRMLWGKKILEWSPTPQDALNVMIELNNRFALDGRNPNSYSGIFWVLGRYDRAWGPEREIFGKIRYMSSDSTRKKLKLKGYLEKYGTPSANQLF